jgi:hypothetical protein
LEHPLITDINHLSEPQLREKVNDLTRKLGFAYKMNNASLIHQLRMALETYQVKLREKQAELERRENTNMPDFGDRIDIS